MSESEPVDDDERTKLVVQQARIAHELLGDWSLKPSFQQQWEPLPLDWFPTPKLRTIAKAANEGVAPDHLPLALKKNGAKAVWPHPDDAVQFLDEVSTRSLPLETLKSQLRDVSERIKIIDRTRRLDLKKPVREIAEQLREIQQSTLDAISPGLETLDDRHMVEPQGPRAWLAEGLSLTAPEEPSIIFGPPGKGKSWVALELAVAVATGTPFGGHLPVRQGRVLYLDYETGEYTMRERYRWAMLDRGLPNAGGHLRWAFVPRLYLTDPAAEPVLMRECAGVSLCVVDSFSATYGSGVDENAPDIGGALIMLHRVSRATGCHFTLVHHPRKRSADNQDADPTLDDLRGSGNIAAHVSSAWAFYGNTAQGATLTHVKSRVSMVRDPITIRINSAATDPRDPAFGALAVRAEYAESRAPAVALGYVSDAEIDARLLDFIREAGEAVSSRAALGETGVPEKRGRVALERLERRHLIRAVGRGRTSRWQATTGGAQQELPTEEPHDAWEPPTGEGDVGFDPS